MKKIFFTLIVMLGGLMANAQIPANPLKKVKTTIEKVSADVKTVGNIEKVNSISQEDVVAGLKEALKIGTEQTASNLSKPDGFFKNPLVKILMPEEAVKVENTLRKIGKGKLVDDAVLSMNRAAEDASMVVGNIFIEAIKNMSIKDAMGILKGGDTAATSYLRSTTSQSLSNSMMPVVKASLDKVNATKSWKNVSTAYNMVSAKKINPDLNAYVTEKAMNALFLLIAEEEKRIRLNPEARVTDLLQRVFANR